VELAAWDDQREARALASATVECSLARDKNGRLVGVTLRWSARDLNDALRRVHDAVGVGPRCFKSGYPLPLGAAENLVTARPFREPRAAGRTRRGTGDALVQQRACEHTFVTSQGSTYARFRRALKTGNLTLIRNAAAELPSVDLVDALEVCIAI
jgi:hypothetical protein